MQNIARRATAFGKPVLKLNGDAHVYLSDNRLSASDPRNYLHAGENMPNFHRFSVPGSPLALEWLRFTVNPCAKAALGAQAFAPFGRERVTQLAIRNAGARHRQRRALKRRHRSCNGGLSPLFVTPRS